MAAARKPSEAADVLLEVGTEEIPARFLSAATAQMRAEAERLMTQEALPCGEISVFATPRRLVLFMGRVPGRQRNREVTVAGPLKTQGFDSAGNPTPAAEGFARKHGVKVSDLKEVPGDRGPRLASVSVVRGRKAAEVLPGVLARVVSAIDFPKSMHWPQSSMSFARPIRWVLAMYGKVCLKLSLGGIESGTVTRGLRFVHPAPFRVSSPAEYFRIMKRAGILIDIGARRTVIRREADGLARRANGKILWDERLLDEVTCLVESPKAVLGKYPAESLELPEPVLVAAMQEHQRYFPVADSKGRLAPLFVAISNGVASRAVAEGCERVLKARLADARYFFNEDRKKPLETYLEKLKGVVWQAGAGTLYDKSRRMAVLADFIAREAGVDPGVASRAAFLSKADLVTSMVGEFPVLQGVVGGVYAGICLEPSEVAEAVSQHYRPAGPGDEIPSTPAGCVVALADKADNLAGHMALGHAASGAADPFGLRRSALGIIRIISAKGWRIPLGELFGQAVEKFAGFVPDTGTPEGSAKVVRAALDFIRGRLEVIFEEQGFGHDEIRASMVDFDDILTVCMRLKAIAVLKSRPGFKETVLALSRVTNIIPGNMAETLLDPGALEGSEKELWDAHEREVEEALNLARDGRFEEMFGVLSRIKPAIDAFFDKVLVMDKDEGVRNRRLALLRRIERTIRRFANVKELIVQ